MVIDAAEAIVASVGRNYVLVKLETDDGAIGWGEATLNGRERAVESALSEHILPEITGMDADRIEHIHQFLYRNTYWRGGPVLSSALSGVDMALWDLKAKRAGLPLYELLGGRTREYATGYAHCSEPTLAETVEECESAVLEGFTHLRIDPYQLDCVDTKGVAGTVSAIADRLGPGPQLIVEIHGREHPIDAANIAAQLESEPIYFLEDPIRPENKDALETVRERSTIPLATGELFTSPWEVRPLIEDRTIDFLRVDLAHIGGVTAATKLAAIAEHHYVRTAFHGPPDLSPVGFAATVHVDLATPNFGIQESPAYYRQERYPELWDVFEGYPSLDTDLGGFTVPDKPGLGVEIDEQALRAGEYERSHLPTPVAEDGSVMDW